MEYKVKVCGLGAGVGKSAITFRYIENRFVEEYDPTVEETYSKEINLDGQQISLRILDSAEHDDGSSVPREDWIRRGQGFLIVYAINSRTSFDLTSELRQRIARIKDTDTFPLLLVGNKCDLEDKREVTKIEGEELANSWKCPFLEMSAKTGRNVDEAFLTLARLVRDQKEGQPAKAGKACCIQ